jgi:hypothetical protein
VKTTNLWYKARQWLQAHEVRLGAQTAIPNSASLQGQTLPAVPYHGLNHLLQQWQQLEE